MTEKAAFTEAVVASCRDLGRARIVLRNMLGLSEVFADLVKLEVRDGWIHLVQENAHLHLDLQKLHAIRFHGSEETGEGRAISLCGERGCPLVVVVLDQLHDGDAEAQVACFERLRTEYGPISRLVSAQDLFASDAVEAAPADDAKRKLDATVAGSGTMWH
jgi:hypothetical protein